MKQREMEGEDTVVENNPKPPVNKGEQSEQSVVKDIGYGNRRNFVFFILFSCILVSCYTQKGVCYDVDLCLENVTAFVSVECRRSTFNTVGIFVCECSTLFSIEWTIVTSTS